MRIWRKLPRQHTFNLRTKWAADFLAKEGLQLPVERGLGEPQGRYRRGGEEKNLLTLSGIEPLFLCRRHISLPHYTVWMKLVTCAVIKHCFAQFALRQMWINYHPTDMASKFLLSNRRSYISCSHVFKSQPKFQLLPPTVFVVLLAEGVCVLPNVISDKVF